MTPSKLFFNIIGALLVGAIILFGGLRMSGCMDRKMRKAVNKNPAEVKAVVTKKSSHKGKSVFFLMNTKAGNTTVRSRVSFSSKK